MGAEVVGVALDPYSEKDNFVLSGIGGKMLADIRADIRDGERLKAIFREYQPEVVFHLAAQPLVRLSYEKPVETYEVGLLHVRRELGYHRKVASVGLLSLGSRIGHRGGHGALALPPVPSVVYLVA
jgi:GDP-D-mannose dehydratase